MNLMRVSRWRNDPEQIISGVSARLLAWMRRGHTARAFNAEEVAAEIGRGLCEIVEAQSAVVLGHYASRDELVLLSATGLEIDANATESNKLPAGQLIHSIPLEPVCLDEADPHVQVVAGDLRDFARRVIGPVPDESVWLQEVEPSFMVGLSATDPIGGLDVNGVALLWASSSDGMLPGVLQPALHAAALQSGGWIETALRGERLVRSYRQLAEVFADVIDGKVHQRTGHAAAVAYYAGLIAREMGLPDHDVELVEFAGLLHAIGKIAVPDDILLKGAGLTDEELEVIRSSATIGADWVTQVEGLHEVATIIHQQGERYDGGGYPEGLAGEDIVVGARILAVALRFSAMTKPRADRPPMSVVGGALESVAQDAGSALDPVVVKAFLSAMGRTV